MEYEVGAKLLLVIIVRLIPKVGQQRRRAGAKLRAAYILAAAEALDNRASTPEAGVGRAVRPTLFWQGQRQFLTKRFGSSQGLALCGWLAVEGLERRVFLWNFLLSAPSAVSFFRGVIICGK
ncbi:MAG: hypothetical protein WAU10_21190 [Caldilineaceae bacterium]